MRFVTETTRKAMMFEDITNIISDQLFVVVAVIVIVILAIKS